MKLTAFLGGGGVRFGGRSAWMLHHNGSIYASKGLVFVGLAASLGALRYAGVPVGPTHELFSRIAATVGIPLIGMQVRGSRWVCATVWWVRGWAARR
jgi:hypothetical protein